MEQQAEYNTQHEKVTIKYEHQLTENELIEVKNMLSQLAIDLNELSEEKKAFLNEIKKRREPVEQTYQYYLDIIKTGREEKEAVVRKVPDFENNIMQFISIDGEILKTRELKQDERQLSIK